MRYLLILILFISVSASAQYINRDSYFTIKGRMAVGKSSESPAATSSWLEIGDSNTTKSFILPRVGGTSLIANPKVGMLHYDVWNNKLYYRKPNGWFPLLDSASITIYTDSMTRAAVSQFIKNNTGIYWTYNAALATFTPRLQLTDFTTDSLPEGGLNKYFTNKRVWKALTAGTGIAIDTTTGVITANAGTGSVTSVGLNMPTGFNVTGGPITATGSFGVTIPLTGVAFMNGSGLQATNIGPGLALNGSTLSATGLIDSVLLYRLIQRIAIDTTIIVGWGLQKEDTTVRVDTARWAVPSNWYLHYVIDSIAQVVPALDSMYIYVDTTVFEVWKATDVINNHDTLRLKDSLNDKIFNSITQEYADNHYVQIGGTEQGDKFFTGEGVATGDRFHDFQNYDLNITAIDSFHLSANGYYLDGLQQSTSDTMLMVDPHTGKLSYRKFFTDSTAYATVPWVTQNFYPRFDNPERYVSSLDVQSFTASDTTAWGLKYFPGYGLSAHDSTVSAYDADSNLVSTVYKVFAADTSILAAGYPPGTTTKQALFWNGTTYRPRNPTLNDIPITANRIAFGGSSGFGTEDSNLTYNAEQTTLLVRNGGHGTPAAVTVSNPETNVFGGIAVLATGDVNAHAHLKTLVSSSRGLVLGSNWDGPFGWDDVSVIAGGAWDFNKINAVFKAQTGHTVFGGDTADANAANPNIKVTVGGSLTVADTLRAGYIQATGISGTTGINLIPTAVKTANYTLSPSDFVPVNNTSGNIVLTLPNAPADKTIAGVKLVILGTGNIVTINTAGADVYNKASGSTSATLKLLNQAILLQYQASTHIWYVIADDIPLSAFATYNFPTTPANGDLLIHNGTDWQNRPMTRNNNTAYKMMVWDTTAKLPYYTDVPSGGSGGGSSTTNVVSSYATDAAATAASANLYLNSVDNRLHYFAQPGGVPTWYRLAVQDSVTYISSYSQNFNGLTPPAKPAGWNTDASLATVASIGYGGTNALRVTAGGTYGRALYATLAPSRNQTITLKTQALSSSGNQVDIDFNADNATLGGSVQTYYLGLVLNGSSGVYIKKFSGGSSDVFLVNKTLATPLSAVTGWFTLTGIISYNGSNQPTISGRVQRDSDGFYLNTSGTWQSAPVSCISYTDTSSPLTTPGYVLIGLFGGANSSEWTMIDDLSITYQ
jgi:hypothetical protein